MERIIHNLVQGSPEWQQFRLEHNGASEAAAMLGLSKKATRTELLRMKHTGIAKEFSDWVQKNILDYGHEVEALARPIVEKIIGEDLYPATYSYGRKSASCDGLTMSGQFAFEHKQWSEGLAASVRDGILPEEHQPQCQQVMDVTGAEKLIFVVSDGTPEKMVYMWVSPDPEWVKRIDAGWAQFEQDLAAYVPQEVIPAAVAAPIRDLPALNIQITGNVVASNLVQWKDVVTERIAAINTDLQSDQDFADAAKMVTFLDEGEKRIDLVKAQAQSQAASIDEVFRAMDEIRETMKTKRLELNKLVEARKASIRVEILQGGAQALFEHIAALNDRIGKPYMPTIPADFAGAMKNKRTIDSLRAAVDHELTRCKLEANTTADRIEINLRAFRAIAGGLETLFPDIGSLVIKAADDFKAVVEQRVANHKREEDARLERERARIREEEQAKAAAEAAAQIAADRTATPPPETAAITPPMAGPAVAAGPIITHVISRAAPAQIADAPRTDAEMRADCNRALFAMTHDDLVETDRFIRTLMAQSERVAA